MSNIKKTSHIPRLLAGLAIVGIIAAGLGACETQHASVTFPPRYFSPSAVAVDSQGDVFIVDRGNSLVEKVTSAGVLSIVAGTDTPQPNSVAHDASIPATKTPLNQPGGVAVDRHGTLYIADTSNGTVEKVTPSGLLSIVAGAENGNTPIPGSAMKSPLGSPSGVAVNNQGDLYIADSSNNIIEKVTPTGLLSIVAGNGRNGSPTPGPVTNSSLNAPSGVAVDRQGNLYIADQRNSAVEKVTPSGILSVLVDQGSTMGTPQVVTK